jgi:SPP1 gp7 family putative phage head morphogenesis protein
MAVGKGPSVNAEVLDRIIAHAVYLEQYKNHEVRRIVGFLNTEIEPEIIRQLQKYAGRELTTRRLMALRESAREIIVAGYVQLGQDVTDRLRQLGAAESRWNLRMLESALGVDISLASPSLAAIRAMIQTEPVHGRFVKEWLFDLGPATLTRVNQQIMLGATMGEGIEGIVRRIAGTRANRYADGILQRSRSDLAAIARTAVAGVSNQVRQETYLQNAQLVHAVQYVATLDLRTCEACGSLDGSVHELEEGPRPPIHPGCRCTTVPVLKSWQGLGLSAKDVPAAVRASLDGQVPGSLTFPDWLRGRSAADQDRVLGQTKGRLYRAGEVQFQDFVAAEDKTRILTLAELENRL